jgi:predicted hotdog family 3-hydroxylacyl-ACP dehydratase
MILLDEIVSTDEFTLTAALTVRPGSLFFESGRGVSAHVAMEWMAQACGAYLGIEARKAEEPIRVGLLLGTRDFRSVVPWFLEGKRLNVTVTLAFRDPDLGMFDCVVADSANGEKLANASLSIYHGKAAAALIEIEIAKINA